MSTKEIPSHIKALASALKAGTTIDSETCQAGIEGAEGIFEKHLEEQGTGLTIDTIKKSQEALLDYATAQTLAVAEAGQELMLSNKEVARISAKEHIGHSLVETTYDRKKSGTAMGKPWEKYGVANTDVTIGVGRAATHYKNAVAFIGEEATKVFAS